MCWYWIFLTICDKHNTRRLVGSVSLLVLRFFLLVFSSETTALSVTRMLRCSVFVNWQHRTHVAKQRRHRHTRTSRLVGTDAFDLSEQNLADTDRIKQRSIQRHTSLHAAEKPDVKFAAFLHRCALARICLKVRTHGKLVSTMRFKDHEQSIWPLVFSSQTYFSDSRRSTGTVARRQSHQLLTLDEPPDEIVEALSLKQAADGSLAFRL